MSYEVGRALVIVDVIWSVSWFAISLWFIADATIEDVFRDTMRSLLIHFANTGGLLYAARKKGPFSWGAAVPFLFALEGDIEASVALIVTLPDTHLAARIVAIILGWTAVFLTVCGSIWFLVRKLGYNPVSLQQQQGYQKVKMTLGNQKNVLLQ